ncbi:conserved hypothetical protein [Vibrio nigripulchritudo MADA3029]|uniref:hypothetical protein n=1 Tax=Vibrio nigripulchritudo TaxID=28173 RepID=UPI0003B1A7A8|nr:hypothetical protein [Vibrio nigripulchritudo]CCN46431.1 conserved hypothetical protein [Vibrio nigripulchritudo MADA3020]CCN53501.1 conserved hypothetical protein [Vibrio nigripulchritudo MADA3021]CCN58453.1 conserved hypothetical protein [Vibrio nigripulchritudo MADA3029]
MPKVLKNDHVELTFKEEGGHLDNLTFSDDGEKFSPMHRAPWMGKLTGEHPVILQQLSGDFFCAPFGESDFEPAPPHGWSSNGDWHVKSHNDTYLSAKLEQTIYGATLTKRIVLQEDSPFVYHLHEFEGGKGAIPVSYHAMLKCASPVILSFSPFTLGFTIDETLEPDPTLGRSLLKYPQTFKQLERVELANGQFADLSVYPWSQSHEDILHLMTSRHQNWSWSAALCKDEGWLYLAIKPSASLPQTTLWQSHGGRDYPPFSSTHTHVLGIEEGNAYSHLGHKASVSSNPINQQGYSTALPLLPGTKTRVGYAFGVLKANTDWHRVQTVEVTDDRVVITGDTGTQREVMFHSSLLIFSDTSDI